MRRAPESNEFISWIATGFGFTLSLPTNSRPPFYFYFYFYFICCFNASLVQCIVLICLRGMNLCVHNKWATEPTYTYFNKIIGNSLRSKSVITIYKNKILLKLLNYPYLIFFQTFSLTTLGLFLSNPLSKLTLLKPTFSPFFI